MSRFVVTYSVNTNNPLVAACVKVWI